MNITFYLFSGEAEEVNKVLTSSETHTGHFKGSCDYIMPEIEFKYTESLMKKNYAYIPVFGGYYFVSGRRLSNNNLVLNFELDDLYTFREDIKKSFATITRTATGELYLPDPRVRSLSKQTFVAKKLGSGFQKENNYILKLAGSQSV